MEHRWKWHTWAIVLVIMQKRPRLVEYIFRGQTTLSSHLLILSQAKKTFWKFWHIFWPLNKDTKSKPLPHIPKPWTFLDLTLKWPLVSTPGEPEWHWGGGVVFQPAVTQTCNMAFQLAISKFCITSAKCLPAVWLPHSQKDIEEDRLKKTDVIFCKTLLMSIN